MRYIRSYVAIATVYTYVHTCIHTYTHRHRHTDIQTQTQTYRHRHTQTHRHRHTDTDTQTHTHTHVHTYTYIHIHTYIHIRFVPVDIIILTWICRKLLILCCSNVYYIRLNVMELQVTFSVRWIAGFLSNRRKVEGYAYYYVQTIQAYFTYCNLL